MSARYLLDTNAASYAINKKTAAMDRHLAKTPMAELGISAVTEGELRHGAARSASAPLQATVEQFLLGVTIFTWDSEAARHYGELRATLEREGRLMGSERPRVWKDQEAEDGGLDEIGRKRHQLACAGSSSLKSV